MIDFPITDSHVHLWDTDRFHYPWLDAIPELNKPFLLEDYSSATGSIQLESIWKRETNAERRSNS